MRILCWTYICTDWSIEGGRKMQTSRGKAFYLTKIDCLNTLESTTAWGWRSKFSSFCCDYISILQVLSRCLTMLFEILVCHYIGTPKLVNNLEGQNARWRCATSKMLSVCKCLQDTCNDLHVWHCPREKYKISIIIIVTGIVTMALTSN
jgi:hypothetical protein